MFKSSSICLMLLTTICESKANREDGVQARMRKGKVELLNAAYRMDHVRELWKFPRTEATQNHASDHKLHCSRKS
jgi:hypothetical protein